LFRQYLDPVAFMPFRCLETEPDSKGSVYVGNDRYYREIEAMTGQRRQLRKTGQAASIRGRRVQRERLLGELAVKEFLN